MTWTIVFLLLGSGLLVGFINTLAGGGSVISLSLFMFLGMPPALANGTNRIPILLQTLTSSIYFIKHKVVDTKKIIPLGIFLGVGSILGAVFAVGVEQVFFERAIAIVLFIMLLLMIFKPNMWEKENLKLLERKLNWKTALVFLVIGFYGGFIYVGLGYLLLAALVGMIGFDLVKANALKNVLVFVFIPFTLVVFMWNGDVNYTYGFVHAIGNVIGASIASVLSLRKGVGFVRWLMIGILAIFTLHYSGIFDLRTIFGL